MGRQADSLLGDSATSQAVSTVSREGSTLVASQASQAGRLPSWGQCYFPDRQGNLLGRKQFMASKAGSQAGSHLPGDSATSQAGSTVPPNNIPTREGPFNAGNNPSTQAGMQVVTQAGRQTGRCSTRCRAPRLPKGTMLLPRQVALVPGKALNPLCLQ